MKTILHNRKHFAQTQKYFPRKIPQTICVSQWVSGYQQGRIKGGDQRRQLPWAPRDEIYLFHIK